MEEAYQNTKKVKFHYNFYQFKSEIFIVCSNKPKYSIPKVVSINILENS